MAAQRDASPFHGNGIAKLMFETLVTQRADYTRIDPRLLSNRHAEEAVIAALLLDDARVWREERVDSIVTPEMFFDDVCRAAYRAALWLRERDYEVTVITLRWAWVELHWIDEIDKLSGGAEVWLAETAGKYFTAIGVAAHARIIAALAERRAQLTHAQDEARRAVGAPPAHQPQHPAFEAGMGPVWERPEYQGELS